MYVFFRRRLHGLTWLLVYVSIEFIREICA